MKSIKVVKNDLFDYKNRYIMQLEEGFKFSIDSILLAEYANVIDSDNVLDMCTGNIPVPLILSTKNNAKYVGFEIQDMIANLAQSSIDINKIEDRIKVINDDIKNINNYFNAEYFDVITCNPPYFKTKENGYKNKNDYLTIARHEITIDLESIFQIAFKYLKNKGCFYLVHRVSRLDDIMYLGEINRLRVKELVFISTKKEEAPNTVLVKCVKNASRGVKIRKEICLDGLKTYQNIFE